MRTSKLSFLVVLSVAILTAPTFVFADIVSTFDTDEEGWISVGNGAGTVQYSPSGGNPGGAITITDIDNGFAYFQAPSAFENANLYNQSFAFDMSVSASGPDPIEFPVQLVLEGNGMALILGLTEPTSSFSQYDFHIHESAPWRIHANRSGVYNPGNSAPTQAEFLDVLDNLTGIYVSADHTNGTTNTGTTEVATLDNVTLSVPEPSTASLLFAAGLICFCRSRNGRG